MNKTITSNIAGYVFHIDENAFDKLDAYLNTIRSYFSDSQGKEEIIGDIEARLAEMLQEKIGDMKQVVTLDDVNHVIEIMGRPESFMDDDPDTAAWTEQKSESRTSDSRRLFRDPDNRVGAGICSGISHYIGLHDPIWIRLAFVVAAFLSFGTALILYVILYLIIPQATSTADKLQMRGENVTVSNIEKRVNEEMETVKNKWNDLSGNNGPGRKVGNAIHRAITLIGSLIFMFIKFIGKIIGFFFLLVGLLGFLSILSIPFGLPTMISLGNNGGISSFAVQDIMHNLVGGTGMMIWMSIAGLLICGIPMLVFAFIGSKLLFNYRGHSKGIVLSMVTLWIIGIVMSGMITMIVMSDFSSEGSNTETVELALTSNADKTIQLALNHELGDEEPKIEADLFDLELVTAGNSSRIYGKPELNISMAKTGGPKLIIKRLARAKKKQEAVERASKIAYGFIVNDTALLLNGYFGIPEDELWRTQDVELELLLPVGYTIFLSNEMGKIIYDIENVTNTYYGDMLGRRWIMTPKGLECVDCDGLKNPNSEEHHSNSLDDIEEIEINIKLKKRELEKEQKRLEIEMEIRKRELEKIDEELEGETEQAAGNTGEILLKRVINASYWVNPTTFRRVRISYPG